MSLSDVVIRRSKPGPKPYKLSDGDGLFLLIQPNGSKWWRMKYFFEGKEKSLSLGIYPEIGLADARERRAESRRQLAQGRNPSEVRQEDKRQVILKNSNTFELVAREWHKTRLHKWTPLHAGKIMRAFEIDIFPSLGSKPIADIKPFELLDALRKVESRGARETAHRLLQNLGQVFTYAVVTERVERNAAADLRGALEPVEKKNNAYLKEEELPEFLHKLKMYDGHPQTKLALEFLLLTFVRTAELRGAQWTEINWEKADWRIPAERMKMREQHIVPLSTQSLAVLRELQKISGESKYIFPNIQKPSGSISENTLLFALYRMGYHGRATGHGFRATASTVLNENGFRPDIIERQLGHCERNKVRAAYNHAQYLPDRRAMMQWWADFIDQAAAKKNSSLI